ncbi:Trp biosynthesis-associated membrane protein [Frankia sp. CNm7]|uniref:Trp biosynthesis-associated membrane protein n=2 Tax=Frankia nepalensis TaxID=1836974 RepID=A0A937RN37_9ACTN|nr:Trp biosynthesis-associated membrane protein [Frankia nepalensis]MBL7509366.1 Trp biosynthesis-associated membrane protein [Frankia nepalensis]MBL7524393.1 Trp biosynthesis-associated membrane protein [Frankia nepalensis]MBL7630324.1 Trp biosynthesis-associated membrane protein [Frankia nepalensis]
MDTGADTGAGPDGGVEPTGRTNVPMRVHPRAGGSLTRRLAGRSGLGTAVVGCLVGAALVLFANSATWVRAEVADAATAVGGVGAASLRVSLSGGDLAPAVSALGLLGLAAVVALVATRGAGRRVVGTLVAAAGVGVLVLAARVVADPDAAALRARQASELAPSGQPRLTDSATLTAAPVAVLLGGLVLLGAGALAVAFGGRWPAMGGRYQTRSRRPLDDWDAIERGHDPTDPTA